MYQYKVIASRKDYAYFSRDTLENHRKEYEQEQERWKRLAEERQRQCEVRDVESRLLREPTPVLAKALHEVETARNVSPDSPKSKAVDFDLLELLLPGYRSKDSKDFNRPTKAPMYEPLPGPGWFRLLVIEPWCADNDRLRCHLRAARLDDAANKYSALSYCWTQPVRGEVQGLVCNGLAIDVVENLRLALENTRYSTLPRILWVDALCINQNDLIERATIQWKWIGLAAGIIRTNHDELINAYRMPNLYNAYLISRLSTHGPLPPLDVSLLSLLRLTTGFKTTEKLDVVYALLGFLNRQGESSSSGSSSETVKVDYTLSESELGISVAESHMAQPRRPLSFLSDAAGISERPTWSPRWTHKMVSMLDPWSLNDDTNAFNPAKGLSFKRSQSTDPKQLNVEGVQITQVAWQTATFGPREDFGSIMTDLIRMLHRCHGGWDIWNAPTMPVVARTLCGGRDRYGGRAKDLDHLTTEFSDIIRTWLRCHPEEFAELSQALNLERPYSGGRGMTWVDASETVCLGRRLFYTTSGHIGLGPGEMGLDDVVCILGGSVMPIVIRPLGDCFGIVGDCYVDGVMDGQAIAAMAQGKSLCGLVPVNDANRQAQLRYEPLQSRLITFC
ncbi:hypothetical protein CEP54_015119 [Fusarium duplospermum]|uniref:Heterokaryon incompatibility domain-containing protein n=1 Tax=Fusarium duplospermum TaxID=1325734 RepID=A0A428NRJ1_9HYPO|nr:hypothetical protein CEP54_015119 [Fusarium duplospermum]